MSGTGTAGVSWRRRDFGIKKVLLALRVVYFYVRGYGFPEFGELGLRFAGTGSNGVESGFGNEGKDGLRPSGRLQDEEMLSPANLSGRRHHFHGSPIKGRLQSNKPLSTDLSVVPTIRTHLTTKGLPTYSTITSRCRYSINSPEVQALSVKLVGFLCCSWKPFKTLIYSVFVTPTRQAPCKNP